MTDALIITGIAAAFIAMIALFLRSPRPRIMTAAVNDAVPVYREILDRLTKMGDESYATFEATGKADEAWLQIANNDLATCNAVWPIDGGHVKNLMLDRNMPIPENIEITADENYQYRRVVTFTCNPWGPEGWALFINDYFRKIHGLNGLDKVSGWCE